MRVAVGSDVSSAGETIFSNSLAGAALLALWSDPSPLDNACKNGCSGLAKTSLTCSFLLSAMRTVLANSFLLAFWATFSARLWLHSFFLMSEKVFSFFFIILSWDCFGLHRSTLDWRFSNLKASFPILWASGCSLPTSDALAAVDKLTSYPCSELKGFHPVGLYQLNKGLSVTFIYSYPWHL